MRRFVLPCVILALMTGPAVALAQTPSTPAPAAGPSVTFGGQLFYDFTSTRAPQTKDADGNTISLSAFNVSRSAFDIHGRVSNRVSFRLTPDVVRDTSTSPAIGGSLTYRVEYAFAQFELTDAD